MSFGASVKRRATAAAVLLLGLPVVSQAVLDGPVQASVPSPTIEVESGGQPIGTVSAGDVVSVKSTQASPAGTDGQRFESVWAPGTGTIDLSSIDAPEGFDLEYRTGTATWSATVPNPTTSITGIRAIGGVTASAYNGGVQTWQTASPGALVSGAAAFQGSSGGDGWDVFFNDDASKVFNIWHHNGSAINLDCHLAVDGSSCYSGLNGAGGTVFQASGYLTGGKSSAGRWNNKLYSFTVQTSNGDVGFYCIDVTGSANPTPCSTPFIQLGTGGSTDWRYISEVVQVGSKIYAFDLNNDVLMCLDAATGVGCPSQPYNLGVTGYQYGSLFLAKSASKVFVASTDGKLACWDPSTNNQCWAPITMASTGSPLGPDGSGGVCYLDLGNRGGGDCVDSSGTQYALPSGLNTALTTYPINGLHASFGSVTTIGTKLYWGGGSGSLNGTSYKLGLCFDFADPTTAICSGFTPSPTLSHVLYATVADPVNSNCVWGNGDNGKITSFNATTGSGGCTLPIPEVSFPHNEIAPEMACGVNGGASVWREFTLSVPAAVSVSGLTLRVFDSSGATISGWNAIDLGLYGSDARLSWNAGTRVMTVDLASLSPVSTGASPEFRVVTADGTTESDALLLDASLTYDSPPPQLCFNLTVAQNCPALSGVAPAATVPAEPLALVSTSTVTASGVATVASASNPGTVADISGCLGTVVGVALDESGDPVAGVPVSFKTGSTTHATVNTNAAGHAVFTNVYPFLVSTSALEFKSSSSFRPVSQSAVVDLLALTAGNTVTGSAVTYMATPNVPPPPPTTAPVVATPPSSVPPSTSVPPSSTVPSPSTTVVPVPVVDETGEEVLPDLEPGESVVYDDGVAEVVEVLVEESTDLVLRGQDFELRLKGDCSVRLCEVVEENAREVLELDVDGAANVSGYGFKPGTQVHIWLFSEPKYLGWLWVLEDGTFEGSVDLLDVEWGEHTLQVNGISFDDQERTANLGVRINGGPVPEAAPVQLPATGSSPAAVWWGLVMLGLGLAVASRRRPARTTH